MIIKGVPDGFLIQAMMEKGKSVPEPEKWNLPISKGWFLFIVLALMFLVPFTVAHLQDWLYKKGIY